MIKIMSCCCIRKAPFVIMMLACLRELDAGGVPSLEYLGIGYNAITGNPRGTESSNIDPGFRASVIKLINDQNVRTVDAAYTVPLGTELRYVTSCEYSSEAVQVSSSASYQRQLTKTATSSSSSKISTGSARTTSRGFAIQGAGSIPIPPTTLTLDLAGGGGNDSGDSRKNDFSQEAFFSQSESYQKESAQERETESSSFEAQGACAEFEVALKNGYKHELHESFLIGLSTLPVPYDKDSKIHKKIYLDFISEYGTHYITRVTLGAKKVITSVITMEKVKELESQKIDISSSWDFKTAQSEENGEFDSSKGNGSVGLTETSSKISGKVSASGGNKVTINNYSKSSNEESQESSLSTKEKDILEISQRLENTFEFNIGGLPAVGGDWKRWARTVKEKPMPISYDVSDIVIMISTSICVPCLSKKIDSSLHYGH